MSDGIRVLLAGDQRLVRAVFAMLIKSAPGMSLVGQAGTGREAVEMARSRRADLVVMDIRMPDLDGIEATRRIAPDEDLAGKVLVLTTYDTDEHLMEALRAGASCFLVKDTKPADLLDAIHVVAAGEALLSRAHRPPHHPRPPRPPAPSPPPGLDSLSGRERQVLTGRPRPEQHRNRRDPQPPPLTAKTHVSRIMVKVGTRDRAQFVSAAYESGLVTPGSGPGIE